MTSTEIKTGFFNNNQNDQTYTFTVNTTDMNYLGQTYLVFYVEKKHNSLNLFENLHFCYNDKESIISNEFLHILLRLYSYESVQKAIDKMLEGIENKEEINEKIIYIPLKLFFCNHPVYAKNQKIIFKLTNVMNCNKIELIYDDVSYEITKKIENKIPIEIFTMITTDVVGTIKIPNNGLQEILWIYKNNNSNDNSDLNSNLNTYLNLNTFIHPVSNIKLKCLTDDDCIIKEIIKYDSTYFIHVSKCVNHTNCNYYYDDLYSYSFCLNPENFNSSIEQIIGDYCKTILMEQIIKNEYTDMLNECKQILCIKSMCYVDVM